MNDIEELFRVDRLEEKPKHEASYTSFSISLIILSLTILIYVLATFLFDSILEEYSLYHTLNNWYIVFSIFIASKSFLGIGYILVGNFYVRLTRYIKLARASLTSFLLTLWGIMHLYDSIILFSIWPTPEELLQMLEETTQLTIYLNALLTISIFVALFYIGLNFTKFGLIGFISRKLVAPGILIITGSMVYLLVSLINLFDIESLLFLANTLFYTGEILLFLGFFISGYIFSKAKRNKH